jgi:hypothetical protein
MLPATDSILLQLKEHNLQSLLCVLAHIIPSWDMESNQSEFLAWQSHFTLLHNVPRRWWIIPMCCHHLTSFPTCQILYKKKVLSQFFSKRLTTFSETDKSTDLGRGEERQRQKSVQGYTELQKPENLSVHTNLHMTGY